ARWVPQLGCEQVRDLGRPEELALEVHHPLRRAKCPHVRLEDPEVTLRNGVVDVVRDGSHELGAYTARELGRRGMRGTLPAGDLAPAQRDVRSDVADERPFDARRGVVPAHASARRVCARVDAIAAEPSQVDPADVGDASVDDHELLVVTVHRPLARVECQLDLRAAHELGAVISYLTPRRSEERQWRTGPRDETNVDSLRERAEQFAHGRPAVREPELRVDVPPGHEHVALSGLQIGLESRERGLAVDEDLDTVAVARRRVSGTPERAVLRRRVRVPPAEAVQAVPVMCEDGTLDTAADGVVQTVEVRDRHRPRSVSADTAQTTR